jgi:ribonucleoside-diphosphate reductase alpha chain
MKGTSGKKLAEIYLTAWKLGLKTTYYLRTLAASQVEKSTLDASKYGFTQKREYTATPETPAVPVPAIEPAVAPVAAPVAVSTSEPAPSPSAGGGFDKLPSPASADANVPLCRIDDPDCEACQ